MRTLIPPILLLVVITRAPGQTDIPRTSEIDYAIDIQPILAENCFLCHGFDISTRKAGLRLDTREGATAPGQDGGQIITPGDPDASLLLERLTSTDHDWRMPPGDRPPLPPEQLDLLRRWIEQGAAYSTHWSFRPIADRVQPAVAHRDWVRDPLDAFILAELERAGLSPAREAERRTLARRAFFDLIGLPPTPEEMKRFLDDETPGAFERLVDRLLASPHFGEHWGRHWLDLMRFAETHGHEFDYPIKHAWQYRDYVIRALNADLPYDDFVREHIAGDLLDVPRAHPDDGFNESVIATGWWYMHQATHSPVDVLADEAERMDNQIDVLSRTFLGLTVSCARCHDHKFDPIPQKDYYSLASYLQSSRRVEAFLDPDGRIARARDDLETLQSQVERFLLDQLALNVGQLADDAADPIEAALEHLAAPPPAEGAEAPPLDPATEGWARTITAYGAALAAQGAAADGEAFDSFDDGDLGDWFNDGQAFRGSPTSATRARADGMGVTPAGIVHTGLLSDRLQGALRSQEFVITKPYVVYRTAGTGGRIRLIVDGYYLDEYNPLLFDGMTFSGDTGGGWRLHSQRVLDKYIGHRAHIEILDEDEGWIAVDDIWFSDHPAAASGAEADIVATLDGLKDQLAAGPLNLPSAALVSGLLQHGLIGIDAGQSAPLRERHAAITADLPAPMRVLAMQDGTGEDQVMYLRGNHRTPGEVAPRRFLEVLAGTSQPPVDHGSGRAALAERMVDLTNPLTSRVIVNRVWSKLTGVGLVESVDDFGALGRLPSHSDMLDHLAHWFMHEADWSLRKLIRKIVLSSTYRMSSEADSGRAKEVDPQNRLLHAMRSRRLSGEAIRDAMLTVSGELDRTQFGPSREIYLTEFMQGRGRPGKSGELDGDRRRSIYLKIRRNFLSPFLQVFDMPVPAITHGRRFVSNVPAQALSLLNDPFVHLQAERWAKRLLEDATLSDVDRIELMFLQAFARPPHADETELAAAFLAAQHGAHQTGLGEESERLAWTDLAHALLNIKEFVFIE